MYKVCFDASDDVGEGPGGCGSQGYRPQIQVVCQEVLEGRVQIQEIKELIGHEKEWTIDEPRRIEAQKLPRCSGRNSEFL